MQPYLSRILVKNVQRHRYEGDILREENWERIVAVVLNQHIVSRSRKGVLSTPLVRVDGEEINVSDGTAREIFGKGDTEFNVIGVGVSNGNDAVNVVGDISLHVTDESLEVAGNNLEDH